MTELSQIDVGSSHPFVCFEHVNINSGGLWDESFERFYFKALGFVEDPRTLTMQSKGLKWINLGHQQIHLPAALPAQKVRGHISLEYSNIFEVQLRLQEENVAHKVVYNEEGNVDYIETACPVGNVFHLYQQSSTQHLLDPTPNTTSSTTSITPNTTSTTTPNATDSWLGPLEHITPCIEHALPGGIANGLGMSHVDFFIPAGSAVKIGLFYDRIFNSHAIISTNTVTHTPMCVIHVGCRQSLRFTEVAVATADNTTTTAPAHTNTTTTTNTTTPTTTAPTNTTNTTPTTIPTNTATNTNTTTIPTTVPEYDFHHIAVYVNDFTAIYARLVEAGLVYENTRFEFRYGSLEEVLKCNEFRLLNIIDFDTQEVVYQLEHEIRSLDHPAFACKWLLPKKQT